MTRITGGCACGKVRYEIAEAPIFQAVCHCSDCQKSSGSAFAEVLLVAADRFAMSGAEPRFHASKAKSGRTMNRGFCSDCGSQVVIRRPETPQFAFVQAGSLDDPSLFQPMAEVFVSEARQRPKLGPAVAVFSHGPSPEFVSPIVTAHFAKRA